MLCEKPFTQGMRAYGCGRCMPCLFNRRRTWAHRIMLEANMRSSNSFVTLTYLDSKLPVLSTPQHGLLGNLHAKHLQDWLKRLRAEIAPYRIRFFAVGEYGDETWRPHYHAALFGFETCLRGRTRRRVNSSRPDWDNCCNQCRLVGTTWSFGDVDLGTLDTASAQYLAGYVTKKMQHRDDSRLLGRNPEFSRMSLRPGVGAGFMPAIADTIRNDPRFQTPEADVPSALRVGSRALPLGRYLRKRLRKELGRCEKTPDEALKKYELEVLPLLKAAQADPDNPSLQGQIIKAYAQKILQLKAKSKIYKQGKTL